MRAALRLAITGICTMVPCVVFAATTSTLEFSEGSINAQWRGQGPMTMQKEKDGIVLQTTDGTGMLLTDIDVSADGGTFTGAAATTSKIRLAWAMKSAPNDALMIPIVLTAGSVEQVDFSFKGTWQAGPKTLLIIVPPQTAVKIAKIELTRWNVFEKMYYRATSFWMLDTMSPYSINFVWGPQLGSNPAERSELYALLPPIYTSATFVIQILLLVVIASIVMRGIWKNQSKRTIAIRILGVTLFVWIVFDARMGAEFLSWVWQDRETYIALEPGDRNFRDRDAFYDFADVVRPLVADRSSYVFFAERPWPYLGNMRYLTYPSIPGIDYLKDDTWVVYRRPDLTIDAEGRIAVDGEPVTAPGKILGRFDDSSFVFRVSP